jgi:hypothetical protein
LLTFATMFPSELVLVWNVFGIIPETSLIWGSIENFYPNEHILFAELYAINTYNDGKFTTMNFKNYKLQCI